MWACVRVYDIFVYAGVYKTDRETDRQTERERERETGCIDKNGLSINRMHI